MGGHTITSADSAFVTACLDSDELGSAMAAYNDGKNGASMARRFQRFITSSVTLGINAGRIASLRPTLMALKERGH